MISIAKLTTLWIKGFGKSELLNGVPLNTVRELLGHTSVEMTLRYAHLAPEQKEKAVATLDRVKI